MGKAKEWKSDLEGLIENAKYFGSFEAVSMTSVTILNSFNNVTVKLYIFKCHVC